MTTPPAPSPKDATPSDTQPVGPGQTRTTHDQSTAPDAAGTANGSAAPRVEPQLPHEIDESAHSQARAAPSQVDVGNQAFEDTVGPSQDTDRGPVLDKVYNGKIAPDRGDSEPRR